MSNKISDTPSKAKKEDLPKLPDLHYIMAFDVASNKTGWALYNDKKDGYVDSGVLDTSFSKCKGCKTMEYATNKDINAKTGKPYCNYCRKSIDVKKDLKPTVFFNYGDKLVQSSAEINYQLARFLTQEYLTPYARDSELYKRTGNIKWTFLFEVSDHGSSDVRNKLNNFVGIIANAITNLVMLYMPKAVLEAKIVQPREWQLRVGMNSDTDRNNGKDISVKRAAGEIYNTIVKNHPTKTDLLNNDLKMARIKQMTDDEADAINIATQWRVLKDYQYVKKSNAGKLKTMTKLRNELKVKEGLRKKYEMIADTKKQMKIKKTVLPPIKEDLKLKEAKEFLNKTERQMLDKTTFRIVEIKDNLNTLTAKVHGNKEKKQKEVSDQDRLKQFCKQKGIDWETTAGSVEVITYQNSGKIVIRWYANTFIWSEKKQEWVDNDYLVEGK